MNILIFLAVILVTIVLAIFINRLVRCPLLVGFIFFSIALLVAIILSNLTLVILAIIFKSCCFFRNNSCLNCHNPYEENNNNNNENANSNLRIINSNGEVVASINGDSINCYDEDNDCCCNSGRTGVNTLLSDATTNNNINTNTTSYSCNCRGYRRRY